MTLTRSSKAFEGFPWRRCCVFILVARGTRLTWICTDGGAGILKTICVRTCFAVCANVGVHNSERWAYAAARAIGQTKGAA